MAVNDFDVHWQDHYETITPDDWLEGIRVGKGKHFFISATLRRWVRWATCRIFYLQREVKQLEEELFESRRRLRELGYPTYEQ